MKTRKATKKRREEWEAILKLKWTGNREYERQRRAHNRRLWDYNHRFDPPGETDAWFRRMAAAEDREYPDNANVFGRQELRPATTGESADAPNSESAGVSQMRASLPRPQKPTKDISRRTRGGVFTKNTARFESDANCGTQSQQAASILAEASKPDRPSKRPRRALDEPNDSTPQGLRRPSKREPKVYKKERESRRLAGYLPEFGMLPKRGGAAPPPYEPPSNTRKPKISGPSPPRTLQKPIESRARSLKGFRSLGDRRRLVQRGPRSNLKRSTHTTLMAIRRLFASTHGFVGSYCAKVSHHPIYDSLADQPHHSWRECLHHQPNFGYVVPQAPGPHQSSADQLPGVISNASKREDISGE